jgi:hypothetical protein
LELRIEEVKALVWVAVRGRGRKRRRFEIGGAFEREVRACNELRGMLRERGERRASLRRFWRAIGLCRNEFGVWDGKTDGWVEVSDELETGNPGRERVRLELSGEL